MSNRIRVSKGEDIMFDLIFDMVCGNDWDTMVIVTEDDCLYGIPCGYKYASDKIMNMCGVDEYDCEPIWEKKVKLSSMKASGLTEFHHSGLYKRYGLLIERDRDSNELHVCCAEDDWGGFTSVQDYNPNV